MQLTEKQKSEGWRIVKFGDVAQEVKASTKDPLGEGIERYIGLEHIDPESLRLTRYGLIAEDNPTFTKKFTAGDILFGRRRAYLKKASVADFDGICSGDITVIAPKGEDLVPDLLPFIVQSEPFFDWAVKHSAGGLSPRTKFKSLAEFEFPLPPRPRQEEMLEVLLANEEVIFAIDQLQQSNRQLLKTTIKETINKIDGGARKVSETINKFSVAAKIKKSDFQEEGAFPIVDQSKSFIAGYWDNQADINVIKKPVVVFGDHTRCFKFVDFDFAVGADGVKVLAPVDELDPHYFYYSLLSLQLPNLGYSRHFRYLKDEMIKIPSIDYQKTVIKCIKPIEDLILFYDQKIKSQLNIRKKYIKKIIEEAA